MLLTGKEITLRSISELTPGLELDQLADVGGFYSTAIDNSTTQHDDRNGVFHPSSVGYCKRSNVMQKMGIPASDRKSKSFQEIVDLGHAIHEIVQGRIRRLQETLKSYGINSEATIEVPCDRDRDELFLALGIAGTCDALLRMWTPKWEQRSVVEIKSQNEEWFEKVRLLPRAFDDHLKQAHLYAYRFDAPIIWVWYYNKNNSKRELKPHFFDTTVYNEAVDYFVELNMHVDAGTLPDREESWFECKECSYRTKCGPSVLKRKRPSLPLASLRRAAKK